MKILVVEDNVAQAESLEMLLRATKNVVYVAPDVATAKEIVETHPSIDGVILDWVLRGDTGLSFLQWFRSQEQFTKIPVVISTGLPGEEVENEIAPLNLEGITVLEKVCDVAALLKALHQRET